MVDTIIYLNVRLLSSYVILISSNVTFYLLDVSYLQKEYRYCKITQHVIKRVVELKGEKFNYDHLQRIKLSSSFFSICCY